MKKPQDLWLEVFDLLSDRSSHNENVKVKSKCSRFLDSHSDYAV